MWSKGKVQRASCSPTRSELLRWKPDSSFLSPVVEEKVICRQAGVMFSFPTTSFPPCHKARDALIAPSLETGCNEGERLCFPQNLWAVPTLKARERGLGAGPYLPSSSLTFSFHTGFPNALLFLPKCSLTENTRDCCWVDIILPQYGSATAWQAVTYYVQWNIYVTVATCFKMEK